MSEDVRDDYQDALDAINRGLADIKAGVALQRRRNHREGLNWGHVGCMRHIADQLSQISETLEDWNQS